MQQPPIDLRMPATEAQDSVSSLPGTIALLAVAFTAFLAVWIALMVVQGDHDPNAPMSDSQRACFDRELQKSVDAIGTGGEGGDTSKCIAKTPSYAAHPFWYALIVGLAVFVIGRVGLFMYRMERARGY